MSLIKKIKTTDKLETRTNFINYYKINKIYKLYLSNFNLNMTILNIFADY